MGIVLKRSPDGFPYVFLCFGEVACYYDAKRVSNAGEKFSLWQYC